MSHPPVPARVGISKKQVGRLKLNSLIQIAGVPVATHTCIPNASPTMAFLKAPRPFLGTKAATGQGDPLILSDIPQKSTQAHLLSLGVIRAVTVSDFVVVNSVSCEEQHFRLAVSSMLLSVVSPSVHVGICYDIPATFRKFMLLINQFKIKLDMWLMAATVDSTAINHLS